MFDVTRFAVSGTSVVESISFSGEKHSFEEVMLCGERVRLWKPTGAVSDTTLEELDPHGTFLAMKKELKGLTLVEAGKVMTEKTGIGFLPMKNRSVAIAWTLLGGLLLRGRI